MDIWVKILIIVVTAAILVLLFLSGLKGTPSQDEELKKDEGEGSHASRDGSKSRRKAA